MGFGNMRGKGTNNELAYFDELLNNAKPEELDQLIVDLNNGERLMTALKALAGEAAEQRSDWDAIDSNWFCGDDGQSMWVDLSIRTPGQIHAVMRATIIAIAQARSQSPDLRVDMYATCKYGGDHATDFRVALETDGNGVLTVDIYGPYNMSEGGGKLTIDEARKTGDVGLMESANPADKPVYYGSSRGLGCDQRGDYPTQDATVTTEDTDGRTLIRWDGPPLDTEQRSAS